MDIHNKEFKHRGRNGYDRYEVDSFLDEIVDNYGDALDMTVDLRNENANLEKELEDAKKQNHELQVQMADYKTQKSEVEQVLVSAQTSATKIKKEADEQAKEKIDQAKEQAKNILDDAKHQKETLASDYERLKAEAGKFRMLLKSILQDQIDSLDDDKWQKALDKYYADPRFYPDDGSEPIEVEDKDILADLIADQENEDLDDEEDEDIDEDLDDEVESNQAGSENNRLKPMTGDSPSHETIVAKPEMKSNPSGPTIVFPDDYKK